MLRIAVPNKGSLSDAAVEMLREAGYRTRRDTKELVARRPRERRRVLLPAPARHRRLRRLRHRRRGRHRPRPAARLGLAPRSRSCRSASARSTFRYAAPAGRGGHRRRDLAGKRGRDVVSRARRAAPRRPRARRAEVVRLDGAVETAITLGVADVIADVVETGTTLRQQGLEVFGEPILRSPRPCSSAATGRGEDAGRRGAPATHRRASSRPATYVMLDYDVPARLVDQACATHPGPRVARPSRRCRTRTGSPCAPWCRAAGRNRLMDELYDLGARAILVTDIAACRL